MSFGKKFLRPLRKNLKHLHQPIKWINKRAIKGRTAFYLRYGNQISKIRKQKMKLMDENSSIYIISFSGWRKVEMITFFFSVPVPGRKANSKLQSFNTQFPDQANFTKFY